MFSPIRHTSGATPATSELGTSTVEVKKSIHKWCAGRSKVRDTFLQCIQDCDEQLGLPGRCAFGFEDRGLRFGSIPLGSHEFVLTMTPLSASITQEQAHTRLDEVARVVYRVLGPTESRDRFVFSKVESSWQLAWTGPTCAEKSVLSADGAKAFIRRSWGNDHPAKALFLDLIQQLRRLHICEFGLEFKQRTGQLQVRLVDPTNEDHKHAFQSAVVRLISSHTSLQTLCSMYGSPRSFKFQWTDPSERAIQCLTTTPLASPDLAETSSPAFGPETHESISGATTEVIPLMARRRSFASQHPSLSILTRLDVDGGTLPPTCAHAPKSTHVDLPPAADDSPNFDPTWRATIQEVLQAKYGSKVPSQLQLRLEALLTGLLEKTARTFFVKKTPQGNLAIRLSSEAAEHVSIDSFYEQAEGLLKTQLLLWPAIGGLLTLKKGLHHIVVVVEETTAPSSSREPVPSKTGSEPAHTTKSESPREKVSLLINSVLESVFKRPPPQGALRALQLFFHHLKNTREPFTVSLNRLNELVVVPIQNSMAVSQSAYQLAKPLEETYNALGYSVKLTTRGPALLLTIAPNSPKAAEILTKPSEQSTSGHSGAPHRSGTTQK
ncbi:MAG: hypothetical protein ACOYKZ_01070 [Chlamydiia bacterium]